MHLSRNRLYTILTCACIAGYIWLYFNLANGVGSSNDIGLCIIKHTTGMPCPSCGSTRSILSLLKGNFSESLYLNPLGILLIAIMVVGPIWILLDFIKKKDSLYVVYRRAEAFLQKKYIAIPAILLIVVNWIWNIYKGI